MSGVGEKEKVYFKSELDDNNFGGKLFPIEYSDMSTLDNTFDVDFNIGFDDFASIKPLSYSDAEIMKYTGTHSISKITCLLV